MIKDTKLDSFYPSTAQHAIREGKLIVENLNKLINDDNNLNDFFFSSMGNMAIIGNKFGIANHCSKYNSRVFQRGFYGECTTWQKYQLLEKEIKKLLLIDVADGLLQGMLH